MSFDPDASALTALDELIANAKRTKTAMVPMVGGASTRRYFRVTFDDAATAVAMFVPEGNKAEEIQKDRLSTEFRRWPFLEIGDLLRDHDVLVPRILAEDTLRGWLLLEDLGDDTLANYLLRRPETKSALYTCAVTDLARAQNRLAELPPSSVVRTRAFDEDLLRWEIDHFREWGLEARGHFLKPEQRTTFDALAQRLAKRIASLPYGFTHRDYQSRNLMVRETDAGPRLVWIDFQDALLGPRVYDLVALLNDSYQEFDRAFVEARLGEFADAAGMNATERASLVFQFDLVTVQRKLKDAGRFVFIERVKGNSSFLKFVTPTIAKVKGSLARLAPADEDMRLLAALLHEVIPDEA
ncbi:MAG: Phosphotransferase involved in threonylcarbamoyladenosine t(6)A37 formation in tRNA [Myxococcaceae bacterium]|jgi:aminoglycoside/choline kinase family phosphotransferase|nr:Phosphotransferase involved in threonylcarbamoyladenosine t(6)A37 formation in tRNA [Myxococcaceae bacterium]